MNSPPPFRIRSIIIIRLGVETIIPYRIRSIIQTQNWGLLHLSHIIKKSKKGNYIHFKIKGTGKIIKELEGSKLWRQVERHTSEYNTQEGVTCQLCLYQVTK